MPSLRDLLAGVAADAPAAVIAQEALKADGDPVGLFLDGVGKLSPFLRLLMTRDHARLERVLAADPFGGFADLWQPLHPFTDPSSLSKDQNASLHRIMRNVRNDVALGIALADLAGLYTLEDVTSALTSFADHAVTLAFRAGLKEARAQRGAVLKNAELSSEGGISIIAMGKHGARELNYSSDIDLIAIFDPERSGLSRDSRLGAKEIAVRAIKNMVAILSDQTEDGFVFRTDLRLRPNPASTAVAVNLSAAEQYYEAYGQNWERAAFIKSRIVAGDPVVGRAFMSMIHPFVWRRSLDFSAVADIFAVKKQIHAQKGNPDLAVRGGDIKSGPGGIREIEFYAQTQQLLLGGQDLSLRTPQTEEALEALAQAEHIPFEEATKLKDSYRTLRTIEHRLQMQEDRQTQMLPDHDHGLHQISVMMGNPDRVVFETKLQRTLEYVHDTYADLFSAPTPDTTVKGSLVFTGVDDDPRTLQTLSALGYKDPSVVTAAVRSWHMGSIRPTKSVRARELLTALVPHMLARLGDSADPDAAFLALDRFLEELPGGLQVFSLFHTSPETLNDVLSLCGVAPDLVRQLGQRPELVESFLLGSDISPPGFPVTSHEAGMEPLLDEVRRLVNGHRARAAAALVLGRHAADDVALALTEAADAAISGLVSAVRQDRSATAADGVQMCVLGFGRLGTKSLTVCSDLDLVFVYNLVGGAPDDKGAMSRLVRRMVSALSVPTSAGPLFEIDMALRPSGGAGPAAVSLSAFEKYYRETAWVWEKMALSKARVISGDRVLMENVNRSVDSILSAPISADAVRTAVVDMRERLMRQKAPRGDYDIKRLPGGIVDIDFVVSTQSLIWGARQRRRWPVRKDKALLALSECGGLDPTDARHLSRASAVFEILIQLLRASTGLEPPQSLDPEVAERIARALHLSDPIAILPHLDAEKRRVRQIFSRVIGPYRAA